MSVVTYFKATLRCRFCGHVGTAWIQNKLGERGATYEVGDCPGDDIQVIDFDDTCLLVRKPRPEEPVRVLFSWSCEKCDRGSLAEVVLAGGCVKSIEEIEFVPATLDRIHYIYNTLDDILQELIGESIWGDSGLREDWLHRLRSSLDEGKRW